MENREESMNAQETALTGVEAEVSREKETHRSGEHHHHHHSHHSHHSEKRSKKSSRPKTKLGRWFRKNKRTFANVSIIVAALVLVVLVAGLGELRYKALEDRYEDQLADKHTDTTIQVAVTMFDKDVPLVGDAVIALLKADLAVPVTNITDKYGDNETRLDVGASVVLEYDVQGIPVGNTLHSVTITVKEAESGKEVRSYSMTEGQGRVALKYLYTGTEYVYDVSIRLTNGRVTTVSGAFRTAKTARVLSIDGLNNVRDIGGWETVDGGTIRQGLLYRGSEMDGAVEPTYLLTDAGRNDMLTVLGIRLDMDLRTKEDTPLGKDMLGANVNHVYYPCAMYNGIFTDAGKKVVRDIFSDLANPSNYPIYLHCTYGKDRTGTICYLLEALLGVREEDLIRDFKLSGLMHSYLTQDYILPVYNGLAAYDGYTLQERVESFLLSTGVTEEEIASIRSILLEY